MRDAGRIGFDIKGEYSGLEAYDFLDVVYYKGSSYVAKKETLGNPPAENNEFWQVLAKGNANVSDTVVSGVKGDKEEKYRTGDVNITSENIGALPTNGGTLESNAEPQLSLKRKSQNFSALLNFENESRKLIQTKGGLENNDPTREAYFSLYDLDADKNGEDKIIELFHLSQNLRNIYDSVTKSMKKILVEGEALPTKDGIVEKYVTIRTGAFPQLRLGRMGYGESVGIEMFHGNVGTDGRGIVLEAWRESEESQDINFGIRNRVSGKSLMMIKSSNSEINSTNRHPLILRSLNEDKTNSVDIRFRVGSVWTNQLCSAIDGEMFFWDSVHEHSLFAVSESKRQIYDYKTNSLQEIATLNDLEKRIEKLEAENEFLRGTVKNLAATEEGYALDATMGKALDEKISQLNGDLQYSTEETDTGKTWINGKKIYRKVVTRNVATNSTNSDVTFQISGIKEIVNYNCYLMQDNSYYQNFYQSSYYRLSLTIVLQANSIAFRATTGSATNGLATAIVEYTKI